jgi:hypothetical protein
MKIIPADPAIPLYGPDGKLVDAVAGVDADETDVFWARRIRAGEAVIAAKPTKTAKAD